jgi:hypothetical protein
MRFTLQYELVARKKRSVFREIRFPVVHFISYGLRLLGHPVVAQCRCASSTTITGRLTRKLSQRGRCARYARFTLDTAESIIDIKIALFSDERFRSGIDSTDDLKNSSANLMRFGFLAFRQSS